MKKVYYFLFAAMGLASCSNEDVFEAPANVKEEVSQELDFSRRSYSEVLEIAKNSISMLQGDSAITRSGSGRTLDLNNVKTYCQKATRANGASANDTLLYVFNFNDNQGFAVVSANRATEGLLAVVEKGSYDPNSKWGDSYAEEILGNYKEYVAEAKFEGCATSEVTPLTRGGNTSVVELQSTKNEWYGRETTVLHYIAPRLKVKWSQKGYTALCCENGLAGSAPIAVAQIMSFHKWPTSIKASYANNEECPLIWDNIIKYCNDYNANPLSTNPNEKMNYTQYRHFAMFIREIGYRTGSQYKNGVTTTDINKLRQFMLNQNYAVSGVYSYAPKTTNEQALSMVGKLTNMSFVVMQGTSNDGSTHTFVIEGCNYYKVREYVRYGTETETWYYAPWSNESKTELNFINWGDEGMFNGWYSPYGGYYRNNMKYFSTGR